MYLNWWFLHFGLQRIHDSDWMIQFEIQKPFFEFHKTMLKQLVGSKYTLLIYREHGEN